MLVQFTGYPSILQKVKDMGFAVFETKDYDLNIIGVRNPANTPNIFDDELHVVYKIAGMWKWRKYKITTDAGKAYLDDDGTAILVHNRQYRGCYILGLHRGNYTALVQRGGEVAVWRDHNINSRADYGGLEHLGYFGINIHRASAHHESTKVDKWSAGCQVFADPNDFAEFIELCELQVSKTGYKKFSYTLLLGGE